MDTAMTPDTTSRLGAQWDASSAPVPGEDAALALGWPVADVPMSESGDDLDLDTHIALVEQRLMAREQRLRDQVQGLGQRARQVVAPRALMLKRVGAALLGVALLWMLRRSGRRDTVRIAPPAQDTPPAVGGTPQWPVGLLPLAWPLRPARGRMQVSATTTAATVLGVAVPLIGWLMARHDRSATSRSSHSEAPPHRLR